MRSWNLAIGFGVALVAAAGFMYWWHTPPSQAPAVKQIRVLAEDSSNIKAIGELAPEFKRKTGIQVNIEAVDFETLEARANTDLSQGTGRYDIVLMYNFSLQPYIEKQYVNTLRELTPYKSGDLNWQFEGDLFPNVWREVGFYFMPPHTLNSKAEAVAYPFAANTMLLVYNRRMYDNEEYKAQYRARYRKGLAPPVTWEQLRRQAEFFTRANEGTFGICLQGADGGWLYYEFMNFLFGLGGRTMDKRNGWASDLNTPLELDTPEAIRAADLYLALKPFNAGGFLNVTATEQRAMMKEGHVALAIMWSDYVYDLAHAADGSWSTDFGFATVPGNRSMIGGGSFYINRKSRDKQAALEFINFVLQRDNQIGMFPKGLNSPLRSTYQAPLVRQVPYAAALFASLKRGTYMAEAGPDATLISQEITKSLQQAWRDGQDGRAAMRGAREAILRDRPLLMPH